MIASPLAGKVLGTDRDQFVMAEWRDPGAYGTETACSLQRICTALTRKRGTCWKAPLCSESDTTRSRYVAGSAVLVPAGTPHTFWNPTADPARYLIIMTANIYQLIQAIHAMPVRTRERRPRFSKSTTPLCFPIRLEGLGGPRLH